jgi:hypothetical protein
MLKLKIQVAARNAEAVRLGLPATLTAEEWGSAIAAFGGLCAYCGTRKATDIEHFVAIPQGGGTTAGNCVPSCKPCNSKKRLASPDDLDGRFDASRIAAIRAYLSRASTGTDLGPPPSPRAIGAVVPRRVPTVEVYFRMTEEEAARLDALVEAEQRRASMADVSRASVLRGLVAQAVATMPVAPPDAPEGDAQGKRRRGR